MNNCLWLSVSGDQIVAKHAGIEAEFPIGTLNSADLEAAQTVGSCSSVILPSALLDMLDGLMQMQNGGVLCLDDSLPTNWQRLAWEGFTHAGHLFDDKLLVIRHAGRDEKHLAGAQPVLLLCELPEAELASIALRLEPLVKSGAVQIIPRRVKAWLARKPDLTAYRAIVLMAHASESGQGPLVDATGTPWTPSLQGRLPDEFWIASCGPKPMQHLPLAAAFRAQGTKRVLFGDLAISVSETVTQISAWVSSGKALDRWLIERGPTGDASGRHGKYRLIGALSMASGELSKINNEATHKMNITHLIALHGRRRAAALAPVLSGKFPIKTVTLICGVGSNTKATEALLAERGIDICLLRLADMDSPGVIKRALDRALNSQMDGGLSVLNLSGANPVFASIATQVFRSRKLPVLTFANRDDKLIWLAVPGGVQPELGIEANSGLTLKEHLALAGMAITGCWQWLHDLETRWNALCDLLVETARTRGGLVADFGTICRRVSATSLITETLPADNPALLQLANCVVKLGYAESVQHGSDGSSGLRLRFKDIDTVNVVSGGWLEHHVLCAAKKLHSIGVVQDAACGLKLDIGGGVENELDGLILANDQLFVIECKARKGKGAGKTIGIGTETIYKIDSIRALRGFRAQAILVTLAEPTDVEARRLAEETIKFLSSSSLHFCESELEKIINE